MNCYLYLRFGQFPLILQKKVTTWGRNWTFCLYCIYVEPATHVNIICHLTLTPLLLFLSWSVDWRRVFLHIAGKLWVHPPFGNSFEQKFNIFRRNWRVTIKTSPPLLRNQVESADVELLRSTKVSSLICSSPVIRLLVLLSLVDLDSVQNSKSSPQVMAPVSSQK